MKNSKFDYREIHYMGGIDKRAIARGGEVIRREVERVVPPLLRDGGFIPSCDHSPPPDISWPNFIEYSRLLAELTGWLKSQWVVTSKENLRGRYKYET